MMIIYSRGERSKVYRKFRNSKSFELVKGLIRPKGDSQAGTLTFLATELAVTTVAMCVSEKSGVFSLA
jgi:hypothetical protein